MGMYESTHMFFGLVVEVKEEEKDLQQRFADAVEVDPKDYGERTYTSYNVRHRLADGTWTDPKDKERTYTTTREAVAQEMWSDEQLNLTDDIVARMLYSEAGADTYYYCIYPKSSSEYTISDGSDSYFSKEHFSFDHDPEAARKLKEALAGSPYAELFGNVKAGWHLIRTWG